MRTKRRIRLMTAAGFLAVLGFASGSRAQEEEISLEQVPKAVMDSATAKFPGAKIETASKETEDGKPVFALKMKHRRRNVGVTFKGDGRVVLVETDLRAKEVPRAVLQAAADRYPGGSLRGVNSVKKGPALKKKADYYELYLLTAKQRPALLKIDPNGNVLTPGQETTVGKRDPKEMKKG